MEQEELIDQLSEPVIKEYKLAFKAVRGCIDHIPDTEWTQGIEPGFILARQVCHLLWACDGYSGGWKVKASTRFGVPAGSFAGQITPNEYPSRQVVLEYTDEVEMQVVAWVRKKAHLSLTGKAKAHRPFDVVIYSLRHTVVHLSYIMRDMHTRGISRPAY
jgi:hypothetical protein